MHPYDLFQTGTLAIPSNAKIVILTSNRLRHRRFALKIQQYFPNQAVLWFELGKSTTPSKTPNAQPSKVGLVKKLLKLIAQPSKLKPFLGARKYAKYYATSDSHVFQKEVRFLERFKQLEPIKISPEELYSEATFEKIKSVGPAILCTLGGPLYKKSLLDLFVTCINQHAGHSPEYKGGHTTDWALYQRNLNLLGSTVHVTDSGADSGAILRRSLTCVFPGDNPATLFYKTVALGTDLMIEVLEDLYAQKDVPLFKQSENSGKTYLSNDLTDLVKSRIAADFEDGWIDAELKRLKTF